MSRTVTDRAADGRRVLRLDGPLRFPVDRALRCEVRALLRHGERHLMVELARVPRIDAAGVGELVRAYNLTVAVNGSLRIVHATRWVRTILERVGLFGLLSGERDDGEREDLVQPSLTRLPSG